MACACVVPMNNSLEVKVAAGERRLVEIHVAAVERRVAEGHRASGERRVFEGRVILMRMAAAGFAGTGRTCSVRRRASGTVVRPDRGQ